MIPARKGSAARRRDASGVRRITCLLVAGGFLHVLAFLGRPGFDSDPD
jgi:hypothetical protein